MKTKRERYINEGELALMGANMALRRALDNMQAAHHLIESADDSLGDVLHYKAAVFEKLDRVTSTLRSIEADVRKMIAEAGK